MSITQDRLFGTNGIRFIPGVTHDLDFVIRIAEAIGTFYGREEVLLGHDGRVSSPALANAAISGLMSAGTNVAEAGLVPTPALQYAIKTMGYKGGVMVTASHNPPEYNGLKVCYQDGIELGRLDQQRIEKIYKDGSQNKADWRTVGSARPDPLVIRNYVGGILNRIDRALIDERKFLVVMDLGNGAQQEAAPSLLEELDTKFTTINAVVDGTFPGRGPEPSPSLLNDLATVVKAVNADLGVAYDGDGDRAIFCDEQGQVHWGDETGCLLADYVLEKQKGGSVVTPVSSTQAIDLIANKRGAKVHRTRVGSIDLSRIMVETNSVFGFEENGGGAYSPHLPVRDGAMTTALMLECLASRGMSLSRALAFSVPKFFRTKTKVGVPKDKQANVMRAITKLVQGHVDTLDGLKFWPDERSWVLIRPSGTEPAIRIFTESDGRARAESLQKKFVRAVKAAAS